MAHAKLDLAVLELGSAVSGAESSILASKQGVPDTVDYIYASTTSATLQAAKEKLQSLRHSTQFSVLDIEREPSEQGFGDKTFDLVVGCNVFDDVQSLEKALSNAKKLLKPGGKLCLVELMNPGIQAMAVLGCVCSWWR
jgi:SAM-dependent methyltransferase